VVFNNAVMHNGNIVGRNMRMRVALTRFTVGCPARVGNAGTAGRRAGRDGIGQFLYLAQAAQALQLAAAAYHGYTGRVVAAVFQATQALDQNFYHIPLRYRADDSTHVFAPVMSFESPLTPLLPRGELGRCQYLYRVLIKFTLGERG